MLFYFIALLIFIADQGIKLFVHKYMLPGQSLPLIGNLIKLTYVRNTGAAFSLFIGFSPYLAMVGLLVIMVVIYFHYRLPAAQYFSHAALALVLGGSLGNLFDRVFHSYVIDYIDIGFWPVFNLADVMINVGVFVLVLELIFSGKKDASRLT